MVLESGSTIGGWRRRAFGHQRVAKKRPLPPVSAFRYPKSALARRRFSFFSMNNANSNTGLKAFSIGEPVVLVAARGSMRTKTVCPSGEQQRRGSWVPSSSRPRGNEGEGNDQLYIPSREEHASEADSICVLVIPMHCWMHGASREPDPGRHSLFRSWLSGQGCRIDKQKSRPIFYSSFLRDQKGNSLSN